jgi:hypothetical protein
LFGCRRSVGSGAGNHQVLVERACGRGIVRDTVGSEATTPNTAGSARTSADVGQAITAQRKRDC